MGIPHYSFLKEKGLVIIPISICKQMGLRKGDLVAFVETDKGVMITRQEVVALNILKEIGDSLKAKGLSLKELLEDGRAIREDLLKEMYGIDAG